MQRLKYMVNHASGFDLAELDLAMRGPGEIYGETEWYSRFAHGHADRYGFCGTGACCGWTVLEQDPELTQYPLLKQRLLKIEEVE